MKLKILITGSNGLLGQKLVQSFMANEIDFLATSKGKNSVSFCPDMAFQKMDITQPQEVKEIIQNYNPTHLINAAAMTNVDQCEVDRKTCYAVNKMGVQNLLEGIGKSAIHLIHVSTDFIFDGKKKTYTEVDCPHPLGEYGKTKWEAECLIQDSNLAKATILRTSLLYGSGENLKKTNIFTWALNELKTGKTLKIVNDQYRTPTYVGDLVEACKNVIKKEKTGIYNVAGEKCLAMCEYVLMVAEYVGQPANKIIPISTAELHQKAPRPQSSGLVIDKAKKELNYAPTKFSQTLSIIEKLR